LAFLEFARGLKITFLTAFKRPTTIQQPEERRVLPERFRGQHALHRYENNLERCIGCFLCAGACPADCIYIEAAENDPENPTSAGERYAKVYEIDELRCIFCGFCEEACPTGAITLEPIFEMSDYERGAMIFDKAKLLDPPYPVPLAAAEPVSEPQLVAQDAG
jgi:NADH-quinone oxidoreductase subunit I